MMSYWKEYFACRIFATIGPDEGRRRSTKFVAQPTPFIIAARQLIHWEAPSDYSSNIS
jgi:hypothetical protein